MKNCSSLFTERHRLAKAPLSAFFVISLVIKIIKKQMSKEIPTRQELVQVFASEGTHSEEEIDKVLSAFIDPQNPEMGLDKFMENISTMAMGEVELNANDKAVFDALMSVVGDVRDARLFNHTYIGHMLTEASIPGMLGYLLGIRTGSNTVAREVSIFESEVEPEAIRGLAEMVGYDPDRADGTFTSGGSMAMQTALMAARRRIENEIIPTVEHPYIVFGTQYTHYSVAKMCDIVAGPSKLVVKRNVDVENFKMNPDSLREELQKAKENGDPVMAIVAIGGETETGLVDPIYKIAEIAEEFGVPMIVDGAYGAPYRLSRNSHLFLGMEKAFAITIDPHKALNTPYSNGAVLFKNGEDKYLGYGDRAGYLGNGANLGQKRIEGSMGAGPILSTLAVFRSLGTSGLETLYDMTLDRVEHLYQVIEKSSLLENLYQPELNLLCFTISGEAAARMGISTVDGLSTVIDEIRKDLDEGIKGEGGYFFSATPLPLPDGTTIPVFRACIMNPRTTNYDLDKAVKGLEKKVRERFIEA